MFEKIKQWFSLSRYKMPHEVYHPLQKNGYIIDYIIRKYINLEDDYIAAYEEKIDEQKHVIDIFYDRFHFDEKDADFIRRLQATYYLMILLVLEAPETREKWYGKMKDQYAAECIQDLVQKFNENFKVNIRTGLLERI